MSETTQPPIISLKGVNKSYGKHNVLKDVNLEIHKGDIFGLIGKNGAGKTTMFKVILGLSGFQSGELQIGDPGDSLKQGRAKVGFFIGSNFFSYMNAKQNLQYYCRLKGIKVHDRKKEIDRVLEIVGLSDVKSKYKQYSLGMKQRLGIANAILGNPEILILDEPTNGLDPQGIADIRKLLQRLNEEFGMTVIVSSHILGELQNTAHRFGIVNNGVVEKVITQEELITRQNLVQISVDNLEKAREALLAAGVEIKGEKKETLSLEDFYFSVVGGEK